MKDYYLPDSIERYLKAAIKKRFGKASGIEFGYEPDLDGGMYLGTMVFVRFKVGKEEYFTSGTWDGVKGSFTASYLKKFANEMIRIAEVSD